MFPSASKRFVAVAAPSTPVAVIPKRKSLFFHFSRLAFFFVDRLFVNHLSLIRLSTGLLYTHYPPPATTTVHITTARSHAATDTYSPPYPLGVFPPPPPPSSSSTTTTTTNDASELPL